MSTWCTETSCTPCPFPSYYQHLTLLLYMLQLMNQSESFLLIKMCSLFRFPWLCLMSFLYFRVPYRVYHSIFCCHVFQAPLDCDNYSDFPCVLWSWQFWGVLVRCFIGCSSIDPCMMFCSWIDGECCVLEKEHRGSSSSHHVKSTN